MTAMLFKVLLLCLITYGHGRPSDAEEHDDVVKETRRGTKHFQHDNVDEVPHEQGGTSTAENVFNRLRSIARLRTADARKPAADSLSRDELEALRDLLDRNLMKYDEHAASKRPNDPYIGQILHGLNAERQPDGDTAAGQRQPYRPMPVRRKIIRHTVFATPVSMNSANRVTYGAGDTGPRVDWSSPFAEYFPILIKDPFQTMMNSFSEIVEYGPAADICRHGDGGGGGGEDGATRPETSKRSRRDAADETDKGVLSHVRPSRTTTTTERPKMYHWAPDRQAAEHNGDTGPQIKRLVVRRGGVAIAGPGGIATAGSGGTAIVGPGGSAYSSKDSASAATADVPPTSPGASMAGYGPHVVQAPPGYFAAYQQHHQQLQQQRDGFGRSADGGTTVLSADGVAYTFPAPSRGLTASPSFARQIVLPDGVKIIATGPIVYYNPEPSRKKPRKTKKSPSKKRGAAGRKPL